LSIEGKEYCDLLPHAMPKLGEHFFIVSSKRAKILALRKCRSPENCRNRNLLSLNVNLVNEELISLSSNTSLVSTRSRSHFLKSELIEFPAMFSFSRIMLPILRPVESSPSRPPRYPA